MNILYFWNVTLYSYGRQVPDFKVKCHFHLQGRIIAYTQIGAILLRRGISVKVCPDIMY